MYDNDVSNRIAKQESLDRDIIKKTWDILLNYYNTDYEDYEFIPMPVRHPFDGEIKYHRPKKNIDVDIAVEIKFYTHTLRDINGDECFLLKQEKLDRVIAEAGDRMVLFFLCLDNKTYIFNPDNLDFQSLYCQERLQKVVQYSDISKKKVYPTYFIPMKLARLCVHL